MAPEATVSRNGDSELLKSLLPSGIASIILHGITIGITAWCLRGCEPGLPAEEGGEQFRTVGIANLSETGPDTSKGNHPAEDTVEPPQDGTPDAAEIATQVVPDTAPSVDELLNTSQEPAAGNEEAESIEVIGPGTALSGLAPPPDPAARLIRDGGGNPGGADQKTGSDDTVFGGIADSGDKFVYLIDTSGSMGDGGRMGLAKNELKSSIRMLKPHHQFQVVFYSETVSRLKLSEPARDLYPANVVNIQKAISKIDIVEPAYGTQYIPAIENALALNPDVLYFLTDGAGVESSLHVEDLLRLNKSGARIHIVEFASGAVESRGLTWLEKLASRTRGMYRRIDVTDRRR